MVIRDSNGAVLASCSQKIPQAYKVEEIEALAALKALSSALELGFQSAILESDSLGLIQALKSEECSLSPTGLLIEDVKMFANNFVRLLYSHIKRNDNRVAHSLAKNALYIPDFQVWMEDIPSHFVSILQLDIVHQFPSLQKKKKKKPYILTLHGNNNYFHTCMLHHLYGYMSLRHLLRGENKIIFSKFI